MYKHTCTHIIIKFKNIKDYSKLPDRKIKFSTKERIKLIRFLISKFEYKKTTE